MKKSTISLRNQDENLDKHSNVELKDEKSEIKTTEDHPIEKEGHESSVQEVSDLKVETPQTIEQSKENQSDSENVSRVEQAKSKHGWNMQNPKDRISSSNQGRLTRQLVLNSPDENIVAYVTDSGNLDIMRPGSFNSVRNSLTSIPRDRFNFSEIKNAILEFTTQGQLTLRANVRIMERGQLSRSQPRNLWTSDYDLTNAKGPYTLSLTNAGHLIVTGEHERYIHHYSIRGASPFNTNTLYAFRDNINNRVITKTSDFRSGQILQSLNGQNELRFTNDGGLELFISNRSVWKSPIDSQKRSDAVKQFPQGKPFAVLQSDGNFVVYYQNRDSKYALWNSNTRGSNTVLVLQNDGNLVIYDESGKSIWATKTN